MSSDVFVVEIESPGSTVWVPVSENETEITNGLAGTIVVEVYERGADGAKGEPGDSPLFADKSYTHTQTVALASWSVAHNLNKIPSVEVLDSAGNKVYGDVRHTDNNNSILTFSGAFSGTAHFN